jgi:hypothetical protein
VLFEARSLATVGLMGRLLSVSLVYMNDRDKLQRLQSLVMWAEDNRCGLRFVDPEQAEQWETIPSSFPRRHETPIVAMTARALGLSLGFRKYAAST